MNILHTIGNGDIDNIKDWIHGIFPFLSKYSIIERELPRRKIRSHQFIQLTPAIAKKNKITIRRKF